MATSYNFGKNVHSSCYIHIEAFHLLSKADVELVESAEKVAQVYRIKDYNVIRISENEKSISFLYYPDFFDKPFPQLSISWRVELMGTQQVFEYYDEGMAALPSKEKLSSLDSIAALSIKKKASPLPENEPVNPAYLKGLNAYTVREGKF